MTFALGAMWLPAGLDVDMGGEAYSFSGEEMCYMAALMKRVVSFPGGGLFGFLIDCL